MRAVWCRDSFHRLHKIVHQNETFFAGDSSERYVASKRSTSGPSRCRSSLCLTGGRPRFTNISFCPVFRTDERFLLLSSILLLNYGEPDGGIFDAKNGFERAKSNLTLPVRRNQRRLANEGGCAIR
jgi:hypothetical protein